MTNTSDKTLRSMRLIARKARYQSGLRKPNTWGSIYHFDIDEQLIEVVDGMWKRHKQENEQDND